jgi:hypothetical protein
MRNLILTLFLINGFLLAGCNALPFKPQPTPIPRSHWVNDWLNKPVCQSPCWENITPGITTISEAKERLKQIPDVIVIRGVIESDIGKELSWNFENNSDGGNIDVLPGDKDIISNVVLAPLGKPDLTLGEILHIYGVPDYVNTYDCRWNQCVTRIVYMQKGFCVETLLINQNGQVKITPEFPVTFLTFFKSGESGFIKAVALGSLTYGKLFKWNGYVDYSVP